MNKKNIKINITPYELFNSFVLFTISIIIFFGVMWMGGTLIGHGGLSYDTYYGKYKPLILISESMTPTIEVNSLLLLENKPFNKLDVNDIILFKTKEYGLVGHRIVEKVPTGFITKGDNNKFRDNWVVTSDMYKGAVVEIHNEFANIITILFGNLNEINIGKLILGYTLIAVFFTWFLLIMKFIYNYICVYFFLKKSSKKGGEYVIKQYYPYIQENIELNAILEIFDNLNTPKGFFKHLIFRYKVLKLHNSLLISERVKQTIVSRYKNIKKYIDFE